MILKIFSWILLFGLWAMLALFVVLVNPTTLAPYFFAPFWFLLFLTISWTIWGLSGVFRRGILYAAAIVCYLMLRALGLGNILNGLLVFVTAIMIDWYLSGR